ncbi:hypothetical protein H0H92_000763 [Tricholoma furcatifolium]|nr:hypothetical protein H0H92_000763 [Tricholoma furcatifolium]
MSSSFGFYMIFSALLTAFFSTVTLATPVHTFPKRDFSGRATYFEVGLGSCGKTNVDSDYIVALNPTTYAKGVHCGKQVRITDKSSGVSATATVEDTCPECGDGDLGIDRVVRRHVAFPVQAL